MALKIGLDMHGVIDKDPGLFAEITYYLIHKGNEVHIITGRELGPDLEKEIAACRVDYTAVFSITSYHKQIGTYVTYKDGDPTQPLIAPPKWDRTKADYCDREGIDIMIDDSSVYGQYFDAIKTQYIQWTPKFRELLLEILWSYVEGV